MPLYIKKIWSGDTDALLTDSLTHCQTLTDRAAQLLIKYKVGAPVTQSDYYLSEEPATSARSETCCHVRQAMPLTDDVSFDAFLNSPREEEE